MVEQKELKLKSTQAKGEIESEPIQYLFTASKLQFV